MGHVRAGFELHCTAAIGVASVSSMKNSMFFCAALNRLNAWAQPTAPGPWNTNVSFIFSVLDVAMGHVMPTSGSASLNVSR
jgi:hypothetical protein